MYGFDQGSPGNSIWHISWHGFDQVLVYGNSIWSEDYLALFVVLFLPPLKIIIDCLHLPLLPRQIIIAVNLSHSDTGAGIGPGIRPEIYIYIYILMYMITIIYMLI